MAAFWPAGPDPMTIMSYVSMATSKARFRPLATVDPKKRV
jgi:alkanesulfonate monooxygenase SsuD/methylene tetrahydromethanopterin reductase-like flavin-dependent oxidoreductase (luciferase family)